MTDLAELPRTDSPSAPAAARFLADLHDAASLCNKCSLCQAVCPTYVVNPVEWETARGRVSLVRDAIEGRLELRDIADGPLSTCLTCDNCVAACAPGVPTADIVTRARMELHAQEGHPRGQTLAFRALLPHPGMLRAAHALSRAAQVTGLHALARWTGLTRWMGTPGALAEHVGPLPRRTAHARVAGLPAATGTARGRVGVLVCCYEDMATAAAAEATMRLLLADGYDVTVPRLGCSGLPAKTHGDRDAMLDMAARTTERLRDLDVDAFVGGSASCTGHVRRFGDILGDDRLLGASAARVAGRTWVLSRFLDEHGLTARLGRLRWSVAYDEPCSLPLDQPSRQAGRRLLEQVPGLRIRPLTEAAMCCGGPGTYFHGQHERSEAILRRKFENVVASGAEVLVTENVSCLLQLRRGAERHAPSVRVMHLAEVLMASVEAGRRLAAVGGRGASPAS